MKNKKKRSKKGAKLRRLPCDSWKSNKECSEEWSHQVRQLRKYNESRLTTHGGAAPVRPPLPHLYTYIPIYTCTRTHIVYLLCPLFSPPTCIRRNAAAVAAQMASIFVLPIVLVVVAVVVVTAAATAATCTICSYMHMQLCCTSKLRGFRMTLFAMKSAKKDGTRRKIARKIDIQGANLIKIYIVCEDANKKNVESWNFNALNIGKLIWVLKKSRDFARIFVSESFS